MIQEVVQPVLKNDGTCFDTLSMSGNFLIFFQSLSPFVPSANSGRALSMSEGLFDGFSAAC
jgi:hypothetical protein